MLNPVQPLEYETGLFLNCFFKGAKPNAKGKPTALIADRKKKAVKEKISRVSVESYLSFRLGN